MQVDCCLGLCVVLLMAISNSVKPQQLLERSSLLECNGTEEKVDATKGKIGSCSFNIYLFLLFREDGDAKRRTQTAPEMVGSEERSSF